MAEKKLLELIKDVTLGEGKNVKNIIGDSSSLRDVFALAEKHQMQHIVAYAMMSVGDMRAADKFYTSFAVTKQQDDAADKISRALSKAEIEHIPLKGVLVRSLYREGWMRNSCDVDVLVRETDHERACDVMVELGFEKKSVLTSHDIAFELAEAHVELHYKLIEDYRMKAVAEVLEGVWADSHPIDDKYHLEMSPEMFRFYHIAHTAKHFGDGGCGIRPVLDLYILNRQENVDREKLDLLLERGGLKKFEQKLSMLAEHWFGDGDGDGLEFMADYILKGGVYGNGENRIAVMRERRGKLGYIMFRLFPPARCLASGYPVLKRHKYLLPFVWVVRLIKAPFKKDRHYASEIANTGREGDVHRMISDLGLSDFC